MWASLSDVVVLQNITTKFKTMQNKMESLKGLLKTFSSIERMETTAENKELYIEVNQLRIQQ